MDWPEGSVFVVQLPHQRPTRFRLGLARGHDLPGDTDLVARVPQRPARLRLRAAPAWTEAPVGPFLAQSAPTRRAFYVGRLVDPDGEEAVIAELWEVPSGRAALARLPLARWAGRLGVTATEPWFIGAWVRVWTWEDSAGEPFLLWAAERPPLTDTQRARLAALVMGAEGEE